MNRRIFEQEQIARAAELDLGVSRPQNITIITGDEVSRQCAEKLQGILKQG